MAQAQTSDRFFIDLPSTTRPNASGDILEVAAATGQFQHFLAAVQAAGYEDTLHGLGPFTIFAPTDEAFREMDQHELVRLMMPRNRDELRSLLGYHFLRTRLTSDAMHGRTRSLQTLTGYRVTVDGSDGLRVNDQLVAVRDMRASNGVIQGINSVLAAPVMIASAGVSGR
ncbi:MAG: fasciclin domain-containing protein [Proteobacteria bacterium]|nr:fasciclin domain-containing protein [Pseudomonadota bacterium]